MDLESFRKPWELEDHWLLRKSFIETYLNEFSMDKLLCYSQLFVNIETLGVSYNKECMDLIQKLSSKVDYLKKYRNKREKAIEISYEKSKNLETKEKPYQSSRYESSHLPYHSNSLSYPNKYNFPFNQQKNPPFYSNYRQSNFNYQERPTPYPYQAQHNSRMNYRLNYVQGKHSYFNQRY